MVNYLHKILVKSPSVCTSYGTSVIAPVCASSVPSIHPSYIMSVIAVLCASSVKSIHTSCIMSVIAPVHVLPTEHMSTLCITSIIAPSHALSVPSVHLYNDEHQEIPAKFPGTKYGEKTHLKLQLKSLTLHQVKFPEETPGTTNRVKYQSPI